MGCSCGHPVRIQTSAEKGLMSSDKKRIDIENGEEELIQDYPGQEPDQPGSPEPQPEPENEDREEPELEKPEAERDDHVDKLLRLRAEFENYRKRVQRESAEAQTRGRASLLAEFLPILDNLDRALNAAEHHEERKVLEGVQLTHSLFTDLLQKEGVKEIDPQGSVFDPELHEAVMAEPSDEEEGIVTRVFERGYMIENRVLRPARVVVSQGRSESQHAHYHPRLLRDTWSGQIRWPCED